MKVCVCTCIFADNADESMPKKQKCYTDKRSSKDYSHRGSIVWEQGKTQISKRKDKIMTKTEINKDNNKDLSTQKRDKDVLT